ncbi:MAG: DUF5925 domain-containing protein [Streptosporangiaceae bacterium]
MSTQRLAQSRLAPVSPAGASPDVVSLAPSAISLDDADTPCDVVDALILPAFADGRQPYARTARVQEVQPEAALTPPGSQVLRVAEDYGRQAWLAAGDGWTIRSVLWRAGSAEVTVTAVTDELAAAVLDQVIAGAAAERAANEGEVTIGFWHRHERRGPVRSARPVSAEPWAGLRVNYASATAGAIDQLMAVTPDTLSGRLILLYGPPGTGKTTALRGLAREWLPWCDTDCVLDPELLFADPRYLMEVALGDDEDTDRWRLLLLEDCDELISGDVRRAAGQALSRLLNLTDGLLGQGRRVLVAITTNENIGVLHPAAIRPGRCLAQIEVGPLPGPEAAHWLGEPDGSAGPMTLADLYAHRTSRPPITSEQPAPGVGLYL